MKKNLSRALLNKVKTMVTYPGTKFSTKFNIKDQTKFEHKINVKRNISKSLFIRKLKPSLNKTEKPFPLHVHK